MPQQLSEQEIVQRLVRLRNLERLYAELQGKCRFLETENKSLALEVVELKGLMAAEAKRIEQLQHTVEEFRQIIFGRKKKPPAPPSDPDVFGGNSEQQSRSASSYRRALPSDEDITEIRPLPLSACRKCGTSLTATKTIVRYVEDLRPLSEWKKALKRVTKLLIATGYCHVCHRRVSASPVASQTVSVGENLKGFVAFANVVLRLSYGQTNDLLQTLAGFKVSDGELDNILWEQAAKLAPEYEQIKLRLNSEPANHYDETSWPTQHGQQGNYAWVKASSQTEEAIFVLGQSRGKGNLHHLTGPPEQVGISDDYGAYRKAFKIHALCWAHPHRKFKDLTAADYLTDSQRTRARVTYQSFAALYQKVRTVCATPFVREERLTILPKLEADFENIATLQADDPQKLLTLKDSLRKNQAAYFVCVTTPGVSPDNNKAERTLRHLVLKRKNSYGSKTQRGADASSILYSVLLSLWRTSKDNFFAEYQRFLQQTTSLQTTASQLA